MATGENTILGTLKAGFKDARTRFVILCALAIIGILWTSLGKKTKSSDEFILQQLRNCEANYEKCLEDRQKDKVDAEKKFDENNKYWNGKFDTLSWKFYNYKVQLKN